MVFGSVVIGWMVGVASASPVRGCPCDEVRRLPVCGVDGVTYESSCEAQCAQVEVAHSGVCAPTLVPETLRVVDPATCGALSTTYAYPQENDHVYAARLANDDPDPFVVEAVDYSLVNAAGVATCNGATPHRIDLWIQDTAFPDANPALVYTTVIQHSPGAGIPNSFYTVDVPDFELESGQQLYVGLSMPNGPAGKLCVLICAPAAPAVPGQTFWSNAAVTPYPWVDMLSFPVSDLPVWSVRGTRVVGGWDDTPSEM